MSFSPPLVNYVMLCFETINYFVIVNATFSFTIRAKAEGVIHGVKISRNEPIISHLLFADDYFLFYKVSPNETQSGSFKVSPKRENFM